MLYTTLALCRANCACNQDGPAEDGGYNLLKASLPEGHADDDLIPLSHIVESNGIEDALWALRATTENSDRFARLFACECAERVLPIFEAKYPGDQRPRQAVDVARRFAVGEASRQDLVAAEYAARCAVVAAAGPAMCSATCGAWSAAWSAVLAVAGLAAEPEERNWQKDTFLRMLGEMEVAA